MAHGRNVMSVRLGGTIADDINPISNKQSAIIRDRRAGAVV